MMMRMLMPMTRRSRLSKRGFGGVKKEKKSIERCFSSSLSILENWVEKSEGGAGKCSKKGWEKRLTAKKKETLVSF